MAMGAQECVVLFAIDGLFLIPGIPLVDETTVDRARLSSPPLPALIRC